MKTRTIITLSLFICSFGKFVNRLEAQNCQFTNQLKVTFKIATNVVNSIEQAEVEIEYYNLSHSPIMVYDSIVDNYLYSPNSNFNIELKKRKGTSYSTTTGSTYSSILQPNSVDNDSIKMIILKPKSKHVLKFKLIPNYVRQLQNGKYCIKIALRKIPIDRQIVCALSYYISPNLYFRVPKTITDPTLVKK